MPKRSSTEPPKKRGGNGNQSQNRGQGKPDPNVHAFNIVQMAIGEVEAPKPPEKNQAAVTLGRLGGLKGGVARAAKLTPERRAEIAKAAAAKRWNQEE